MLPDGFETVRLTLRRPEPHRLDIGYVLARPGWGQGLMTEVLTEIAFWATRQDDICRIGAVCDCEDLASARLMEKAGLASQKQNLEGPFPSRF
jgi:RimJ/RimL family protein N-acetyltransferase